MLRKIIDAPENFTAPADVHASIKKLETYLMQELQQKQNLLDKKDVEINMLQKQLIESQTALQQFQLQQAESLRSIEGNRQLINKLLNEQSLLQQNLSWYKRTYESRTLFGIIKDRIKFYFSR